MDLATFLSPDFDLEPLPPFADLPTRQQIIWLASYPKSGNTWIRLVLAAYLSGKAEADINQDLRDNHQCNNPQLAAAYAKKPVAEFTDLDAARVRIGIQRLYARNPEKIIVKTHAPVAAPSGHATIDPASTFASLLIIRNPLAVLPSFARHMALDLDRAVLAMRDRRMALGGDDTGFPRTPLSSWSSFNRSWISAQSHLNVLPLKFEDMKQSPLETFGKALGHIGVRAEKERLEQALKATEFDKLKAQDLTKGFKERTNRDKSNLFFRSGKVDGWRSELSEAQIENAVEQAAIDP